MVKAKQIDDACCLTWPTQHPSLPAGEISPGLAGPWWQGYANPTVDALLDRPEATVDDIQRQSSIAGASSNPGRRPDFFVQPCLGRASRERG
ncbi:MAG: hypothetical protein U0401_00240 [Anaerolineae bacterium]